MPKVHIQQSPTLSMSGDYMPLVQSYRRALLAANRTPRDHQDV